MRPQLHYLDLLFPKYCLFPSFPSPPLFVPSFPFWGRRRSCWSGVRAALRLFCVTLALSTPWTFFTSLFLGN